MMQEMNLAAISIELGIAVLMAAVLLIDLCMARGTSRRALARVTALGLLGVLALAVRMYPPDGGATAFFAGLYIVDGYAVFFKILFIVGVLATVLFAEDYVEKMIRHRGEFYLLLLSALLGMCTLASANDLMTAFVGLELMTISFYTLVAIRTDAPLSAEAGIKYLVFGSGSTAVLLYGMSLVYGMTGTMMFQGIAQGLGLVLSLGLIGVVFILAGFFFKLSIIPFHLWAPDVYEGAPAPVTALLAMCSKAAGVAILLRVLFVAFPALSAYWTHLMAALACVSMVGGNIMAFRQTNIKRMLAYSSIAQAGYMMTAMVATNAAGIKAVLFYAMVYVLANVGAFVTVSYLETERGGADFRSVRGLAHDSLLPAGILMVALLTMAGIPPTAGFVGKIYIFSAAIDAGYLWLAGLGFVVSMMSVYYYLLVIKEMFRDVEADEPMIDTPLRLPLSAGAMGVIAVAFTLVIGIWAEPLSIFSNIAVYTFMR